MAVRRHRHWGQPLQSERDPPKLGAQDSRFRIGSQTQLEFGARHNIEFGIDLGMDQFECALVEHHSCPRAASTSRKACRAVNSRDFTVLTGHSRMCAISS